MGNFWSDYGLTAQEALELNNNSSRLNQGISNRKLERIHRAVTEQYPYLLEVFESMLITDMKLPDCPIIYANDDFEKMTLYPKEFIVGRNCRFLQGKLTNRQTVLRIREAVLNGRQIEVEILNYRKDGVPFWNNFLMLPVMKRGKARYFIAIQKNVSYLKQSPDPREWSSPEVGMWLERENMCHLNSKFLDNDISGSKLMKLNEHDLLAIGIFLRRDVEQLMLAISELRKKISCLNCKLPIVDKSNKNDQDVCKCENPSENSQSHNPLYCPKIDEDGTNFNPQLDSPQQLEFWRQSFDNKSTAVKLYHGEKIELTLMETEKISLSSLREKAMELFELREMRLKTKDKDKGHLVYLDDEEQLTKYKEGGKTLRIFVERDQHDLISFISLLYPLIHPAIVIQGQVICALNRAAEREFKVSTFATVDRPVEQLVANYSSKCVGQVCPLSFRTTNGTLTSYLCSVSQLLPNTYLLLVIQTDLGSECDQLSSMSSFSSLENSQRSYNSSFGNISDAGVAGATVSSKKLSIFQRKPKRKDEDLNSSRDGSMIANPQLAGSPPMSRRSTMTPSGSPPTVPSIPAAKSETPVSVSIPTIPVPNDSVFATRCSSPPKSSSPLPVDEDKELSSAVETAAVQPPELNKSLLQALETVLLQPKSGEHTIKFLAAFRLFVPASHLIFYVENICTHFSQPSYSALTPTLNVNVVSFIKYWVDNFPNDFASRIVKQMVLNMIQKSSAEGNNEVKLKLLKLHHLKNSPQSPHPGFTTQSVLDVDADKLVMALTCYDWTIWANVKPEEFSEGHWQGAQKETRAPNLHLLATRFDQVSFWAAEKILIAKTVEDRAALIEKFIEIAYGLYKISNFQSMMSVFLGLNLAAISRLRQTWEKVSTHHRAQFNALEELMAPLRNYALYRNALQNRDENLPCFPYVPLLLRDLMFIYETNKMTDITERPDLSANLLDQVGHQVVEILKFQSRSYSFVVPEALYTYIVSISTTHTEESLYVFSTSVEKRVV